jgi:hypothetical protein
MSEVNVQLNVQRWQAEKTKREEKRLKANVAAHKQLLAKLDREPKPFEIRELIRAQAMERRKRYLLKNCRATIAEIQKAFHQPKDAA